MKKHRRRHDFNKETQHDYRHRDSYDPLRDRERKLITDISLRSSLPVGEDRRTWHPRGKNANFKTINGNVARVRDTSVERTGRRLENVGEIYFSDPMRLSVCKRRRERREILFALRKAGKGRGGAKKRKYTEISKIRCT